MKIKQILIGFVGGAVVSVAAVAAVLTPSFGILSAPVFVRASFADSTDIKFTVNADNNRPVLNRNLASEEKVIEVTNARETVMQQIVIAPGGHTGWHSHPGPVVVLIKSGQMSFYEEDCTLRTYSAGQSFIDKGQGHVHIARNESQSENLELWATYFDVPPGGAFRIDVPNPGNCSF
jgi:quercetin dioxygenase-like cupin family protein